MNQIIDSYRTTCNSLTERISELTNKMKNKTISRTEYTYLATRRRILSLERLELLHNIEVMQPYTTGKAVNKNV